MFSIDRPTPFKRNSLTPHSTTPGRTAAIAMVVALVAVSCGCRATKKEPKNYAQPLAPGARGLVRTTELPDLTRLYLDREASVQAIDASLEYFDKPSSRRYFPFETPDRTIRHADQVATLERLRQLLIESTSPTELARAIRAEFDAYRAVGWDGSSGEVLFTGYFTPILDGSLTRDAVYRYPLYRRPADLAVRKSDGLPLGRRLPDDRIVPYYTRAEIEQRDLLAGTELVYLANPFDAFTAHVQGSAEIRLREGGRLYVGYDGKTDRRYSSVGHALVERGLMRADEVSLQSLRQFFERHEEHLPLLNVNESFVFFRQSEDPRPRGSIGAPVTPYHTIATDKTVFPRGGPVVVETDLPSMTSTGRVDVPHVALYLDQDTGGAIRSAGRADLYLGKGADAEQIAGYTRHEGRLFYLFLKP